MEKIEEDIENITQDNESRSISDHSSDSVVCGQLQKVSNESTNIKKIVQDKDSKSSSVSLHDVTDSVIEVGTLHAGERALVSSKNSHSSSHQKLRKQKGHLHVRSSASSISGDLDRSEDEILKATTSYSGESIVASRKQSQDSSYSVVKGMKKNIKTKSRASSLSGVLEGLEDDLLEVALDSGDSDSIHHKLNMNDNVSERVFVQNKKGFEPTTKDKLFVAKQHDSSISDEKHTTEANSPKKFALSLHSHSKRVFDFCHGILAGFGICHISLVFGVDDNPQAIQSFAESFPDFARLVQSLYYCLSAICLVSVLDRCDFGGISIHHCRYLFRYNFAKIVAVLFYFSVLVVTVIAVRWDDRFALSPYNEELWKNNDESYQEFMEWRTMSLLRGIFSVMGYAAMFLGSGDDLFHDNLKKVTRCEDSAPSTQDLWKP